MTEIGFRYSIAALNKKRSELAGEISGLELQIRDRRQDLSKVDDIIRMLSPASDMTKITTKKPIRYLNIFRQGELSTAVLGLLLESGRPMSNLELTKSIFEHGGFEQHLWTPIRRRIRANLQYLAYQGKITKTVSVPEALWSIQQPPLQSTISDERLPCRKK